MARQKILFKELLLEIGYIEQIKTTRGNRGARNLVRLLLLSTKNKFNPFDSVPLATLRFEISLHHRRTT